MKIKRIKIHNFQLFKDCELSLDKIMLIRGQNLDDSKENNISGNGSGKTTLAISAIFFLLYGEVPGLTLKKLVSFGETFAFVEGEIEHRGDVYLIKREIPSDLIIKKNGEFVQFNTNTLKQKYLDELFGDYLFFKQFQTIDSTKGINLLDQGTVSLRKTLMSFIEDSFLAIRKKLLDEKNKREYYNKDKNVYFHYLSTKRKTFLESGLKKYEDSITSTNADINQQLSLISDIKGKISSLNHIIANNKNVAESSRTKVCPTCKTVLGTEKIAAIIGKSEEEVQSYQNQIAELEVELEEYKEGLKYFEQVKESDEKKRARVSERLMKLNGAFKFIDYKYTAADVAVYSEAIKVLDGFSGFYINDYLNNLAVIINNLLQEVNMSVKFSEQKEFIKVKNGEQEMDFDQLSSGQKTFLSAVFKLSILLHKGVTETLILADEGLGNLDKSNLEKFIKVCEKLQYQIIVIYQNIEDLTGIKTINVVRQKGESKING